MSLAASLVKLAQAIRQEPDPETQAMKATAGFFAPTLAAGAAHSIYSAVDKNPHIDPDQIHNMARRIQGGMDLNHVPTHVVTGPGLPAAMGRLGPEEIRQIPNAAEYAKQQAPAPPKKGPQSFTERLDEIMKRRMGGGEKATKDYFQHHPSGAPGEFAVMAPHNPSEAAMAHEFGHVRNHSKWGKNFTNIGGLSRQVAMMGAPIAGAVAAGQDEPSWTPGLVQAGLASPMLFDEAAASARAAKYLTKHHGLRKGLGHAAKLAPAFGTYAAMGLTPLAITAGRKLYNRHQEKKEKQASLGALAGGYAGYKLSPTSDPKKKLYAVLGGAAVGHLTGKGLGAAKREIMDRPSQREREELYGYVPYSAQQEPGPTNFRW